jgi:hypothetical protein
MSQILSLSNKVATLEERIAQNMSQLTDLQAELHGQSDRKRKRSGEPRNKVQRPGGKAAVALKQDFFEAIGDGEEYSCKILGCTYTVHGARTGRFFLHMRDYHEEEFRYILREPKYSATSNIEVQAIISKLPKKGVATKPHLKQCDVTVLVDDEKPVLRLRRSTRGSDDTISSSTASLPRKQSSVDAEGDDSDDWSDDDVPALEEGYIKVTPSSSGKASAEKLKKLVMEDIAKQSEFLHGDGLSYYKVTNAAIADHEYVIKQREDLIERSYGKDAAVTVPSVYVVV